MKLILLLIFTIILFFSIDKFKNYFVEPPNEIKNKDGEILFNYIDKNLSSEEIILNYNTKTNHNTSIKMRELRKIQNHLHNTTDEIITIRNIKEIMHKHHKIKNIITEKEMKSINRVKEHLRKLVVNSLTDNLLEIPNKKFKKEYLKDFQSFLLKKENINIDLDRLRQLVIEVKFEIYKSEILKIIDKKDIDNLNNIAETYLKIYGYNIDNNYIIWMAKISKPNNFNTEDIVDEIKKLKNNILMDKKIDDFSKILNSSKKIKKNTIEDIDLMAGEEFEYFLKELFIKLGYNTKLTNLSRDQGADLIIEKTIKTVVQAKRYSNKVSNTAVQEVIAAKKYYDASKAIVVTNNYFTKSAKELANVNDVDLWDRDILVKKLKWI